PPGATVGGAEDMFGQVVDAIGDLDLSTEQRASVEAILTEARIRHQGMISAHNELVKVLADQIEEGRIDRRALPAPIDKITSLAQCVCSGDVAALETLHGKLDAKQRAEFADALEEIIKKQSEAHASGAGIDAFAKKIGLTESQVKEVRTIVSEHAKAHEE